MQDTLSEKIELRATVHRALDQLETVDLPLDRTIAPRFGNGRAHGFVVLLEPGGKAAEVACDNHLQPRFQINGFTALQDFVEGAHVLGGGREGARAGAERFHEAAVTAGQGGRISRQPPRDLACRWGPSGWWPTPHLLPPPCCPASDDVVATLEAERLKLTIEHGAIAPAFLPVRFEDGAVRIEPARARPQSGQAASSATILAVIINPAASRSSLSTCTASGTDGNDRFEIGIALPQAVANHASNESRASKVRKNPVQDPNRAGIRIDLSRVGREGRALIEHDPRGGLGGR